MPEINILFSHLGYKDISELHRNTIRCGVKTISWIIMIVSLSLYYLIYYYLHIKWYIIDPQSHVQGEQNFEQ